MLTVVCERPPKEYVGAGLAQCGVCRAREIRNWVTCSIEKNIYNNWYQFAGWVMMVSTKELESRMDSYEKNRSDHQEFVQHSLELVQKSIEGLTVAFAAFKTTNKSIPQDDMNVESAETVVSTLERAQIPFPSFDGSNIQDRKAKVEQFFELEGTPESQNSFTASFRRW